MGSFWDLITPPVAVLLVFEVVSTLANIAGFGGFLLRQRAEFEQRFTALDLTHKAQRQQDRAAWRRESRELNEQIRTLIQVIKEINPNADISFTGAHKAVEAAHIKALREFMRVHYSADEFNTVMSDFGIQPDEYQNDTVIARMDRFIRRMIREDRIDDLRDRVIEDRPAAASVLGVEI